MSIRYIAFPLLSKLYHTLRPITQPHCVINSRRRTRNTIATLHPIREARRIKYPVKEYHAHNVPVLMAFRQASSRRGYLSDLPVWKTVGQRPSRRVRCVLGTEDTLFVGLRLYMRLTPRCLNHHEELKDSPPLHDFGALFDLMTQISDWAEANPRHREFLDRLRDSIGASNNLKVLFQNLFPQARPRRWMDAGGKSLLTSSPRIGG